MDVPEAVPKDRGHRPFRDEFTSLLPSGDGEPMSESQAHGDALWSIFFQLQSLREIRYESLGVKEYFVFDPSAKFMEPRLRGYRLVSGVYRELNLGARQRMLCRELDVWLQIEGDDENRDCRMTDRRDGERVLTRMERAEGQVEEESERADREAARAERQAARAEQQAARARQQAARADRESARADQMEVRLDEANARMEAFRAVMRNAGIDPDSLPGV